MGRWAAAILAGMILAAGAMEDGAMAGGAAAAPGCDLAGLTSAARLHEVLTQRAVAAVDLAARPVSAETTRQLQTLVAPEARFGLGAGDVGRELDGGLAGVRMLAADMHANLYIADGWDYMDLPVEEPCGAQKVAVEFLDHRVKMRCRITFTFRAGRIVEGDGWERSYRTGPLTAPAAR